MEEETNKEENTKLLKTKALIIILSLLSLVFLLGILFLLKENFSLKSENNSLTFKQSEISQDKTSLDNKNNISNNQIDKLEISETEKNKEVATEDQEKPSDKINCFLIYHFSDLAIFDKNGNIIRNIGDIRYNDYYLAKNRVYYWNRVNYLNNENIRDVYWLSCDSGEIQTGKFNLNNQTDNLFISNNQEKISYVKYEDKQDGQDYKLKSSLLVNSIAGDNEINLLESESIGESRIEIYGWSNDDKYLYYAIAPYGLGGRFMYPGMINLSFINIETREKKNVQSIIKNILPEKYLQYSGNFQAISSGQKYIAYEIFDRKQQILEKLFIIDLDNGNYNKIFLNNLKERPVNVHFSPDNRRLAYNEFFDSFEYGGKDDDGKSYMQIVISDIDGENKIRIEKNYEVFGWIGDYVAASEYSAISGKKTMDLIFISHKDGEIVERYTFKNDKIVSMPKLEGFLLNN